MSRLLRIPTPTHGRVLVEAADRPKGLLVGFHGYAEIAEIQLARLMALRGANAWTCVSIEALHPFYRGRSQDVVSSWMTRRDRDEAIAENVHYVNAAIDAVAAEGQPARLVVAGFSQGVAMAFRAAVLGRRAAHGVIAVGGGIPPELAADETTRFPPSIFVRGARDEWYTEALLAADVATLEQRHVPVQHVTFDGGHEWAKDAAQAAARFLSSVQDF